MPSSSSPKLRVAGLSIALDGRPVLRSVGFEVAPLEFVVLMGPNGSGKTTLLRAIAGFERPSSGTILLDGEEVTHRPAHRRGIGILFQEPALFPRRSVAENIAYGLEIARRSPAEIDRRVDELLGLLKLRPLADRPAPSLSGGERQRVALARTLAPGPSLVLLDEPFASVDPSVRSELRAVFRSTLASAGVAALHVTHDREEGLFLGDRVLLLDDGRLLEDGRPSEVFERPRSLEAARFLGYNLLEEGGSTIAVHPNDLSLDGDGVGPTAEVELVGAAGPEPIVLLRLPTGQRIECRGRGAADAPPRGSTVRLRWRRSVPLGDRPGAPPIAQ